MKKGFHLTCTACKGTFCAGCIQLEIHKCSGLDTKITDERARLAKTLVKVQASKI